MANEIIVLRRKQSWRTCTFHCIKTVQRKIAYIYYRYI